MPSQDSEGDDGLDPEGVGPDLDGLDIESEGNHWELLEDVHGDDGEGDRPGRGFDAGPGLTEPEREAADERNRLRELERARDRFESATGLSDLGGGGGSGTSADRDALAVIDAAGRFGLDADSEVDEAERDRIREALALHATKPPKPDDEYNFFAIIAKQATQGTNVILTLKVPWEFREEVFRSLETMPFAANIRLTDIQAID
jgi:hypothetical protein